MGDSLSPQDDNEKDIYESIRSRPVTPAKVLKVNAGTREKRSDRPISSRTDPAKSFEICTTANTNESGSNYGLQILGCSAPGINERPLSAMTRLGKVPEDVEGNALTTTDEYGDIIVMTDNFQKLKIARNQMQPCGDAGETCPMSLSSLSLSPEDAIAASATGITIKSLSSNAVVVVPETHRSNNRPITAPSSGEEVRVYPALQKSKLSRARRRRRIFKVGGAGAAAFQPSLPDETEETEGRGSQFIAARVHHEDSDGMSDVGGSDRDYSVPSTARSTMFDDFELMRPETASSEILADGALASEEELQLTKIMKVLGVEDAESWYAGAMGESDESTKSKLRQLTKLFYRRFEKPSVQGMLYTYKLMLGGLHNRLEDFVLLSVPPGFNLKTRITRVKKGMTGRLNPLYYLHLEREGPGDRKCLLLVAKKYKHFRGIGYVLSTDPAELSLKSEYCVGKVSSNFIGTEFTLYSGRSICTHVPLDKGALMALPKVERFKEELATVLYDPNVLGFKGPRKIKVVIPKMKNLLERETIRPRIAEESLLSQYQNEEDGPIWCLKNKDPIWSRETHSYILNFAGRVNTASVKNFQIVSEEDEDHIMLQFGRASDNTFSLDFQYPFCPLQAFAVALTSFDSKLACE